MRCGVMVLVSWLLLAGSAMAETCQFAWDAVTTRTDGTAVVVEGYRLYSRPPQGVYGSAPVVEVTSGLSASCPCTRGHLFVVRAYTGGEESANSNEVHVPMGLTSPTQLRLHVILELQP